MENNEIRKLRGLLYDGGFILLPQNCVKYLYALHFGKEFIFEDVVESNDPLKAQRENLKKALGYEKPASSNDVLFLLKSLKVVDENKVINYSHKVERSLLNEELINFLDELKGLNEV